MLELYLIALLVGGSLLLFSLFSGGDDSDADTDAGGDVDADLDGDVHVDAGHDRDGDFDFVALAWLPIASLRFWTFFLAFFGAAGTALTLTERDLGHLVTGLVAVGVGYVCGTGAVAAFRYMRRSQTSSALTVDDYIGEVATVRVAVARDKVGKVRLQIKGRTVELLAETEDQEPIATREQAMIYAISERGHAMITRTDKRAQ